MSKRFRLPQALMSGVRKWSAGWQFDRKRPLRFERLESRAMLATVNFFDTTGTEGEELVISFFAYGLDAEQGRPVAVDLDLNSDGAQDVTGIMVIVDSFNQTETFVHVPWSRLVELGINDDSAHSFPGPYVPAYIMTATYVGDSGLTTISAELQMLDS